jgi:probable addiction module antidote protein
MKDKPHDDAMAELYREDPDFAIATLNAILQDGDQAELMVVLRQLAKAFGGVQSVAERAHLNATQIYRTLSPEGNPALSSFTAILGAMNLRMTVEAVH